MSKMRSIIQTWKVTIVFLINKAHMCNNTTVFYVFCFMSQVYAAFRGLLNKGGNGNIANRCFGRIRFI